MLLGIAGTLFARSNTNTLEFWTDLFLISCMGVALHSGPGRPREFELATAVEDAIEVFRSQGYHGTSVYDLTIKTGLGRGSLYKAFRDKHSLFLAALAHYMTLALQQLADDLGRPGSARDAIRYTLRAYAERAADGTSRGCLVAAAAMELMPQDAEVSALIIRHFQRTQDLFVAAVIRGQVAGEIPGTHDERAIAQLMLCSIQGLRILSKTRPSQTDTRRLVEAALHILN